MNLKLYQEQFQRLDTVLGNAVYVLVAYGEKRPVLEKWQMLTLEKSRTDAYRRKFDCKCNIGVSLGVASEGLCTIDLDSDAEFERFLKQNPQLSDTLQTRGARGGNIWVRIIGGLPPSMKIERKVVDPADSSNREIGEWRATGNQTVIWGRHPKGSDYQFLVEKRVVEISFADLCWPNDWEVPRLSTDELKFEQEIVDKYGEFFSVNSKGSVKLNVPAIAAKFCLEHRVAWDSSESAFFAYSSEDGSWYNTSTHRMLNMLETDLALLSRKLAWTPRALSVTPTICHQILESVRGQAEMDGKAWKQDNCLLHLKNGMLSLQGDRPELLPFSPDYWSREASSIVFDAKAECPRFIRDLLEPVLGSADQQILQRFLGALIGGRNDYQRILLISGAAGSGKSTLLEIIELIIGEASYAELRTKHLEERFELSRFTGRRLLLGKDVAVGFLEQPGAAMLKKLCGCDNLSAERKHANEAIRVRGNFSIIISSNAELRVRLDSDVDAWKRRLLAIEFGHPKKRKMIVGLAQQLIEQEGSGILNWMIQGAFLLREAAKSGEPFPLDAAQSERISRILSESLPLVTFLKERVAEDASSDVTMAEIKIEYSRYCRNNGIDLIGLQSLAKQIRSAVRKVFDIRVVNSIVRDGKAQRGFKRIKLC